ncbi:hypothetical protein GCM10022405_24130 [Gibbsiella dentisursi]|uniref:HTH luxR-type domain-containing protein n=1 Tax=Gibbsiella dentisursi TaxID=796890 RepID=A0ABP7LBW6_9GAMM
MLTTINIKNGTIEVISDDVFALNGFVSFMENEAPIIYANDKVGFFIVTQRELMKAYAFLDKEKFFFKRNNIIFFICHDSLWKIIDGVDNGRFNFLSVNSSLDIMYNTLKTKLGKLGFQGEDVNTHKRLTFCQSRLLYFYLKGYSPHIISDVLGVSEKTISSHKRAIMKKYGISSTMELLMKFNFIKRIGL